MLRLKRLGIDTLDENVAYLARTCPLYRAEEFRALARVEIGAAGRALIATLNLVENGALLAPDELGLSSAAFARLGRPEGTPVSLAHAAPPVSREFVRAKILGRALATGEIEAIIRDIIEHRYSRVEIAAFLIASASFLSTDEVLGLTRAMAAAGARLSWPVAPVVDKHCIGGIPGNRTSMIVVPIVAAHGLTIPKTSSRAITSPAGTADTMEVLARVEIGVEEMREIVRAERGCLVWGGHVNLSPADDILISVERALGIDTSEQLVASILSKKLSAGSSHLVVDIPVGPTAKIRSNTEAIRLRKLFEFIGEALGLVIDVLISDGAQPIGRGIGPALEARDVMGVLEGDARAPEDLRARALMLAGRVLEFDPALRGGQGGARAKELLDGGQALAAMRRIIKAQGERPEVALGALTHDVVAPAGGVVGAIDCYRLARIARLAGAPSDKGAGIDLFKKLGARVERGEALYRIHAEFSADARFAAAMAAEDRGYRIDPA
jgi:thymidine phosphorylase